MKKYKTYFIIASILLITVIADIILWISISIDPMKTFTEMKTEYLLKFPEILQNVYLITFIDLIFLSVAAYLFYKAQKLQVLKRISFSLLVVSIILICWHLFSLM